MPNADSVLTVKPVLPRVQWIRPCPVRFGWDHHNRRTVTFGGNYGQHDLTVNGVDAELGSWRWAEQGRMWRFEGHKMRRHVEGERIGGDMSDQANAKIRGAFGDMVPRLAERHTDRFDDARTDHAQTQAAWAKKRARDLRTEASRWEDIAHLSSMVTNGRAHLRPTADAKCSIRGLDLGLCQIAAEIVAVNGTIGYAVTDRRSRYSGDLLYVPEHLIEKR